MSEIIGIVLKAPADAPGEFQLLPEGKIEINGDQPAYLDEAAATGIIEAFKQRGNDMVIDYEHQTLTNGLAPAAGWIKQLAWKGKEGLWVLTDWTKKAKDYLKNREYRYFSPVMLIRASDRKIVKLINVALTNNPAINNLTPIVAKYQLTGNFNEREDTMLAKIKKLLGLADDAGEDKTVEAVTLLVNKNKELEGKQTPVACKEILDALGAKEGAGKDEVVQLVASLKTPGDVAKELSLQVAKLTQEIAEIKQADLVTLALKEGKTSPEELDKWGRNLAKTNPEQFRLIVLSRPAGSVIPVQDIQIAAKDKKGVLDDDQRKINEMCGVSDETFIKYNK